MWRNITGSGSSFNFHSVADHNIKEKNEVADEQRRLEDVRTRSTDNIGHPSPHPDTREATREAARAAAREAAIQAAKEAAKEARRNRRKEKERQRSKHQPPQAIKTSWDEEDQEYIVRNNIQRNQRKLDAAQDYDEADDTLFEVPIRMPEVDFTR
ncbi:hypothetical protein KIN20_028731 [Parelaphostrongylus tenuis]|uniref:Uncharacterized protein n=1 Tax=Parelaphostrongylus tenuis TaxID=148309 RepID=A0AAD5R1I1_PARTN|nr:hypothetical protein KIN20_023814 [Parelaphostrongylus tenuis]KAJ1367748.1 hypothetical protein KIN20_028730 [Parelaphostrongylus tenuis]KAJ1367749.1 hypothetical protein KIN20_028731 [Parelaphostrongylus tenuis]